MRTELLVTLMGVLALGCGVSRGGADAGTDAGADASVVGVDAGIVELGTVGLDGGYVPMPTEVPGNFGAQGGMHVNMMYRLPDGAQGEVVFDHEVRRVNDGVLVSRGTRTFTIETGQVPWTLTAPINVFICPTPVGVDVIGQVLRFHVTATSSAGVAAGTVDATYRCPAGSEMFCQQICKG